MYGLVEPLVSISVCFHLSNVSRLHFQLSMSMLGSMDPVGRFRGVAMWLRGVCVLEVSHFDRLCWTNVYLPDFRSSMSTVGSVDPMDLIQVPPVWLCCASAFQVSRFDRLWIS